jgi:endonuclease/exonuclease/phosphatase family metal-dependent hydrolase
MGSLRAMAYNTHLFGDVVGKVGNFLHALGLADADVGWKDDDREDALKTCLKDPNTCGADVVSLEEFWSSTFVSNLEHGSLNEPQYYPNSFKYYHPQGDAVTSNPSGLMLLGNQRITFEPDTDSGLNYRNYIDEIGKDNFSDQDKYTGKGCYAVKALIDGTQQIVFASTHMPTNSHSYPDSLKQCYQILAEAITDVRGDSGCPVLLMGDFNLDEAGTTIDYDGNPAYDRYAEWVGPHGILGSIGLQDVYRTLFPDSGTYPGYTVIPSTNTCWRHFNGGTPALGTDGCSRIDYMMTIGLTPSTFTVRGAPPPTAGSDYSDSAQTNPFTWTDDGNTRDISDHYPIIVDFSY